MVVLWWSWRWRNERVLGDNQRQLNHILRNVLLDVLAWRKYLGASSLLGIGKGLGSISGNVTDTSPLCVYITIDGS